MNWQSVQPFLKNWRTSLGGLLIAVPPLITAAGFVLSLQAQHWLALCQGLGALLVGLAAKDASTHSTQSEIAQATLADNLTKPPAGMGDGTPREG